MSTDRLAPKGVDRGHIRLTLIPFNYNLNFRDVRLRKTSPDLGLSAGAGDATIGSNFRDPSRPDVRLAHESSCVSTLGHFELDRAMLTSQPQKTDLDYTVSNGYVTKFP